MIILFFIKVLKNICNINIVFKVLILALTAKKQLIVSEEITMVYLKLILDFFNLIFSHGNFYYPKLLCYN